jgi:hypothetical protein
MEGKLIATGIIMLIVGLVVGYGVSTMVVAPPAAEAKVFYVLPGEWSFALFDEAFNPIDRIEVRKGDRVTLIILPEPFMPDEIHEELEYDFIEWAIGEGLIASEEDFEEYEEEAEAELGKEVFGLEYLPHGVAIRGYEDRVNVLLEDGEPVIVTFIADREGSFDIYCNLYCGWGHQYMKLSGAFVVRG